MSVLIMKFCLVFAVTAVTLWVKRLLFRTISGGLAVILVLHGIYISDVLPIMRRALVSRNTVTMVLSSYFVTFLRHMLERKNRLKQVEQSLNWLSSNHRVNTSAIPAVISLFPSAGTMTTYAEIIRSPYQDYLSNKDVARVTSFYRHIPENSPPTYSSMLIALAVSDVGVGEFVPAMLSLVMAPFIIGHIFYLRRVPGPTGQKPEGGRKRATVMLFKSLWSTPLIMILLVAFDIPVYVATPMAVVLNIFVDHLKPQEIMLMFRTVFRPVIISNTILIMMFKDTIIYTGAIHELSISPGSLSTPSPMTFVLIFFFGTIVSGSNAIIPLCMPMAIAAMPEAGIPLLTLLVGSTYMAMQVSPTHAHLFIAAECFKVNTGALVRRGIPMILVFSAVTLAYTALLDVF